MVEKLGLARGAGAKMSDDLVNGDPAQYHRSSQCPICQEFGGGVKKKARPEHQPSSRAST